MIVEVGNKTIDANFIVGETDPKYQLISDHITGEAPHLEINVDYKYTNLDKPKFLTKEEIEKITSLIQNKNIIIKLNFR